MCDFSLFYLFTIIAMATLNAKISPSKKKQSQILAIISTSLKQSQKRERNQSNKKHSEDMSRSNFFEGLRWRVYLENNKISDLHFKWLWTRGSFCLRIWSKNLTLHPISFISPLKKDRKWNEWRRFTSEQKAWLSGRYFTRTVASCIIWRR